MKWWICCLVTVRVSAQSLTDQMFWYSVPMLCDDSSFNVLSGRVNPANLAFCESMQVGVLSGRNLFVSELSFHQAVVASPLKRGAASVAVQLFGGSAFRQTVISVAYARGIGVGSVGGGIDMISSSVNGYESENKYSIISGFNLQLARDLKSSVCVRYFAGRKVSGQTSGSPFHFLIGLNYRCSDLIYLSGAVLKEWNEKISSSILLSYQVHQRCNLRLGFRNASYPFLGVTYRLGKLDMSFVFSYHEPLGLESALALQYDARGGF